MSGVHDLFGRPLRDLRVSVTDRCNMRCDYCMPAEVFGPDHAFVPRAEILTFEEIARVVRAAAALGARKVRLTGGEPLLRRDLPALVRLLAAIRGVEDLALTTNGLLLAAQAEELQQAGLHRVTVSLDALDEGLFRRLTGSSRPVGDVLEGMRAAARSGLGVKVNCVVQRGLNEDEVLPLASLCREEGWVLRFIEFMDVGNHNRWERAAVVSSAVLRDRLEATFGLVPAEPAWRGEVARRYCYADGRGEVGFVSSITEPFCRDCNRARLTADGRLVTCLFAAGGPDLRSLLRDGTDDHALALFMRGIWEGRADRYSELRAALPPGEHAKVEMSYVGG
jgi:cyclic pyranopterin phosphate synthase